MEGNICETKCLEWKIEGMTYDESEDRGLMRTGQQCRVGWSDGNKKTSCR